MKKVFLFSFKLLVPLSILLISCGDDAPKPLPIIGEALGISPSGDTIYPTIADFKFIDQDSNVVNNATFDNKIYVVDFFFTHCPTICPKVTAQLLRVHDKFLDSTGVVILSHSIDPKHDTVGRLHEYAHKLGVKSTKWHFVTGERDSIYSIANKYFIKRPSEDADSPGGYNHSGEVVLVDKKRHVRSYCDGTDAKDVDRFMRDIEMLLKEK